MDRKNKKAHKNNFFVGDLIDTPCFDEELMDQFYDGIVSNILIELDKQNMSVRALSALTGITFTHISRILNGKARIGLAVLIKIAFALRISPSDLLPYDMNRRKSNGERYDEITKELDIASNNFLLNHCADFVKEYRRIKHL